MFSIEDAVSDLQRDAEEAAGLSPLPLEDIPDFDDLPDGYETVAEATAALRASRAPTSYTAEANGFEVRPSERCQTPSPLGIGCVSKAFHPGLHSWDMTTGENRPTAEAAMLPGMPEPAQAEVPEPEPDDYDVPYEAQFNKADFKSAPGLKAIAERTIADTPEFAHLRDVNIRYFWKRRGGTKGGNPRYGALVRPSGLAGYALGSPVYALWLAADHIRDAKWQPRTFDAQIFDLLAHSAVDPDDHSAYRILGDDFSGMNLTLTHFGIWQDDLREAAVRMRQLDIEEVVALAEASEAGQEPDDDDETGVD